MNERSPRTPSPQSEASCTLPPVHQYGVSAPPTLMPFRFRRTYRLKGIVSKRRDSAYRSGKTRDWLKIKTVSWRAANRDRWEMFKKS